MEQTPVEWLIDEAMKLVVQYMNGTLNEETLDDDIYRIGTRAKEMEKEQIKNERIEAYNNGYANGQKDAYTQ
jgi:hypothetical protein